MARFRAGVGCACVVLLIAFLTGCGKGTAAPRASQAAQQSGTVRVLRVGFSQDNPRSSIDVGWGAVLRNVSPTLEAIHVTVTADLLDSTGAVLTADTLYVNLIPAGTTYYAGGLDQLLTGEKVARAEVNVHVESSQVGQDILPPVSHVRWTADTFGGTEIDGQVTNPFDGGLSKDSPVTAVLFDKAGHVVGGDRTFLTTDLGPGRTEMFSISDETTRAAAVARIDVSMDNEAT